MIRHLPPLLLWIFSCPLAAQSRRPPPEDAAGSTVALHAGVAYARLADRDFDVVQSVAGQDLFARAGEREDRLAPAVFAGHRVWRNGTGAARLYATLGTGVDDLGEVVFLGLSLGVARALLTAGASTAVVPEGIGPVSDEVFGGTGDRPLFARLDRAREWGAFLAVSFGLIR